MCDLFNTYACDLLTPRGLSHLKMNIEEHREKERARARAHTHTHTHTYTHTHTHTIDNKLLVDCHCYN